MTAAKWFDRLAMFVLDAESDAVGALTFPERQRHFERPAVEVCGGTAKVGRFVDRMLFEAERFGLPDEAEEYRQGYLDALAEVQSLMVETVGSVPVLTFDPMVRKHRCHPDRPGSNCCRACEAEGATS